MKTTKKIIFNYQEANFDRIAKCDYCDKKKSVAVVKYHSTNYNDLICYDCMVRINQYHKTAFNKSILKEVENNEAKN